LSEEDYKRFSTSTPIETISTAVSLPKEELNDPFSGQKIQAYTTKLEQELNNNLAMASYWELTTDRETGKVSYKELNLGLVQNNAQLADGIELNLLNQKGNVNDGFIASMPIKRRVPKPGYTRETAGNDHWTEVGSERTILVKFNDVTNPQITTELAKDFYMNSIAFQKRGDYEQARVASDMASNILNRRDMTTISETKPGTSSQLASHDLPGFGEITWTVIRMSAGGYKVSATDPTGTAIKLDGENEEIHLGKNPQEVSNYIRVQDGDWVGKWAALKER
jgi:hypothetical protein